MFNFIDKCKIPTLGSESIVVLADNRTLVRFPDRNTTGPNDSISSYRQCCGNGSQREDIYTGDLSPEAVGETLTERFSLVSRRTDMEIQVAEGEAGYS